MSMLSSNVESWLKHTDELIDTIAELYMYELAMEIIWESLSDYDKKMHRTEMMESIIGTILEYQNE